MEVPRPSEGGLVVRIPVPDVIIGITQSDAPRLWESTLLNFHILRFEFLEIENRRKEMNGRAPYLESLKLK